MREKIIILGHNSLSRLSVARALGRVGYYVIVVAPKQNYQLYKSLDTYSKYINEYHNCVYQDNELLNFLIQMMLIQIVFVRSLKIIVHYLMK